MGLIWLLQAEKMRKLAHYKALVMQNRTDARLSDFIMDMNKLEGILVVDSCPGDFGSMRNQKWPGAGIDLFMSNTSYEIFSYRIAPELIITPIIESITMRYVQPQEFGNNAAIYARIVWLGINNDEAGKIVYRLFENHIAYT